MLLARWLEAVRQPDLVREVATEDIRVYRFPPGKRDAYPLEPQQTFVGHDAVHAWLARSPKTLVWSLVGECEQNGDRLVCGYRYDIPNWHNTGVWMARGGERIAELWHYPHILVEDEVPMLIKLRH